MKNKSSFSWDANALLSICAIFVSLATMGVYLYQTHLIQKQQYAQAYPYVELYSSNGTIDTRVYYAFRMSNYGLGPAFVRDFEIEINGKLFNSDQLFSEEFKKALDIKNMSISNPKTVLPSNQERMIFEVYGIEDTQKIMALVLAKKIKIKICYRSVYNESWKHTWNTPDPIPCEVCEQDK